MAQVLAAPISRHQQDCRRIGHVVAQQGLIYALTADDGFHFPGGLPGRRAVGAVGEGDDSRVVGLVRRLQIEIHLRLRLAGNR